MTIPGMEPLLLALWGAIVSLDERGIFFGGLASPLIAGMIAGTLVGEPSIGIWTGFLFQAIWPVRIDSGGNIPPAGGLAAVGATGVAVALGAPTSGPGVWFPVGAAHAREANADLHGAFWIAIVILGLALALAARAWERSLRAGNGARSRAAIAGGHAALRGAIRVSLVQAALRGALLVALPMILAGSISGALSVRAPAHSTWLDSAAIWLLPAFLALGIGNLAWALRRPVRTAWLDWTLGATLGAGSALLLDRLR